MRVFWLILVGLSFILWFGNPFSFAIFAPFGHLIDQVRGATPALVLASLICSLGIRRILFISCSVLFFILIFQELKFYFKEVVNLNNSALLRVCELDLSKYQVISRSTEPNVVAESWLIEGKILGRVCLNSNTSESLYNEVYRSVRRLSSSIRHRGEEKIIITNLKLPALARIYGILEEVSKTQFVRANQFSFLSFFYPSPFLFVSDTSVDSKTLIESLISGSLKP